MFRKPSLFLNIFLPVFLGMLMLYHYKAGARKSTEIGLGEATMSYAPKVGQHSIHILTLDSVASFKAGYIERGKKDVFLWLGNSQLHGVNQYKPGNSNSIEFLFNKLKPLNEEVLGVSYPNANLQEFLVSVIYFSKIIKFKGIVLPVFYDDMRESGIRNDLRTPALLDSIRPAAEYFSHLKDIQSLESDSGANKETKNDFSGIKETLQDKSERYLNTRLEEKWDLWKSRPDLRARTYYDMYIWRNILLGIKANTVRKMITGNYNDNYNAFINIIKYCKDNAIPLLIYIPPLRNDVAVPYDVEQYMTFKKNVEQDCLAGGAKFLNIEGLVENHYWGMKGSSSSFSNKLEVDFMHFQEHGHKLIADTIFQAIQQLH